MKKAIIFAMILMSLLLSSCSLGGANSSKIFTDDRSVANAHFEEILSAIKEQDGETLKSMFSKKALTEAVNIDQTIAELFQMMQGEVQSYDDWGGPTVDDSFEDGERWQSMLSYYDLTTDEQKYRFAIKIYTIDTANPDNVGISSMYVINAKDSDLEYAYGGDGEWRPGIIIES